MKDFKSCFASRYCRMQTAVKASTVVLVFAVASIVMLGERIMF